MASGWPGEVEFTDNLRIPVTFWALHVDTGAMQHTRIEQAFLRFQQTADPEHLAEVFDGTAPALLRVAHYIAPDLDAADDLVQASYLAAIEQRDRFDPHRSSVLKWLIGILVNCARLKRRTAGRFVYREEFVDQVVQGPLATLEAEEISAKVEEAIAKLPETYQPVLNLHLRYGLPYSEIALNLNRPVSTIRQQVSRGLKLLRQALPTSIIAGNVVLTTPAHGLAAMREVVLQKASAVTAKGTTTSSLFGLGKITWLGGAGALVAAALAVTLFIPSDDEELMIPHEQLTNSQTVNSPNIAREESEVAPLQSQALRSEVTHLSLSSKIATTPNLNVRRLLTMQYSSTITKPSASRAWTIPVLLLGSAALFPALGSAQNLIYHLDGENAGDQLGFSVSGAADVNQDGYTDLVAGANRWDDPNDPNSGTDHGRVYVYSGQDGTTLFTVDGENASDQFGRSVSGSGDINQDGYADMMVAVAMPAPSKLPWVLVKTGPLRNTQVMVVQMSLTMGMVAPLVGTPLPMTVPPRLKEPKSKYCSLGWAGTQRFRLTTSPADTGIRCSSALNDSFWPEIT